MHLSKPGSRSASKSPPPSHKRTISDVSMKDVKTSINSSAQRKGEDVDFD